MGRVLVCGAGGFIGSHLVRRLKDDGHIVDAADIKQPDFSPSAADKFMKVDLRVTADVNRLLNLYNYDQVYQLAAEMGGAGYIFTGDNDAAVMHNSALININVARACAQRKTPVFFSSSACVYPEYNQLDAGNPNCAENSAYPAAPDSEYGWEKLFSERLYGAFARNAGTPTRIARYHNILGPEGTWRGGREKAPAAICRKVAEVAHGGEIEIWGDGKQTRSFLYVDECVEGTIRLATSNVTDIVNIGSSEMVSINTLVKMVADIAGKKVRIKHIAGPLGVRGRTSDNELIGKVLGWQPSASLLPGLAKTYEWVEAQVRSEQL